MASQTDFFSFYQQLGLDPNCSLAALKNAYRRRIAELHPDRHPERHADPASAARLQELTAAYNAAIGFERRYGRLPGAQHAANARTTGTPPTPNRPTPQAEPPVRRSGLRRFALVVLILAAIAWLLWGRPDADDPGLASGARTDRTDHWFVTVPPPRNESVDVVEHRLELGMDAQAVAAIEGKPMMANAERWDYGPSWIEFDHGKVSDWYSSKLRPLKVASARPQPPHNR